ncbi:MULTISPECIES: hypothetical protein [Lactobacillus]|uniref:Uncharacterized protein n=1 Tax=Myoviridae sp. ctk251 TaxID=2826689 RepID=A0A8S5MTM7_9CAUD|nr:MULTISPECIES: hypothetical protein [Lactobacillus]DAD85299.1 MAG TPA: hypothetical protein [Myoviridae sp. ctk251]EEX27746.1 hypothetical protein HMPREF0527_00798 [Lactobacillus jensenii SJ-7A-US]MCF1778497.1 hypothetical protein [Lactobacillus jensenii]MCF1797539.1 hypothetical protein [Lactobacillus mulieris]MCW8071705.1 hypothetical protein [Lactobacillus jensenii]
MTAYVNKNEEPRLKRVVRIDYKDDPYGSPKTIYTSHLDSGFQPATIQDFVNRYKDQKLVYLPSAKTITITDYEFETVERYLDSEEAIAINTDYIYMITYEKLPEAFRYTEMYKKLKDIAIKFTQSQAYKELKLSGFKIYPADVLYSNCATFIIDFNKFKLEYHRGQLLVEKHCAEQLFKEEKYQHLFERTNTGYYLLRDLEN